MRKVIALFLCVCMVLLMPGCALLRYSSLTAQEMLELSDDNLVVALRLQLGTKEFSKLNESQKVVYTAAALEMTVRNNNMIQFFTNECTTAGPYVCTSLEKLGATEHLALLQADLTKNNVDLTDLSVFDPADLESLSKLEALYNFSNFEGSYRSLPSIPQYIRAYMQAHLGDF